MDSIKDASAQHECPLQCKLDWGFSTFISALIKSLINIGLTCIGLSLLIYSIISIYEYDEGLADLSRIELVYMFVVFLLYMRIKSIVLKSTVPWWKAVFSPFMLIGRLAVILFLVAVGFGVYANKTDLAQQVFLFEETLIELVTYGTVILGLYCGIPDLSTQVAEVTGDSVSDATISTNEMQEDISEKESFTTAPADSEATTDQKTA